MSPDLKDLFDDAGRTPPAGRGYDADDVVSRGARIRTRRRMLTGAATLAVAAVVVGGSIALIGSPLTTGTAIEPGGSPSSSPSEVSPAPTLSDEITSSPSPVDEACTTDLVTVTRDRIEGAAGTSFYALLIKAKPGQSCTTGLFPSVFATRAQGDPIGPAAPNPPAADAIGIAVRGSEVASFTVGITESDNFDPALCLPVTAGALRVTLPGDTASTDVPLPGGTTVCSGNVSAFGNQLTVTPIVAGPDGQ